MTFPPRVRPAVTGDAAASRRGCRPRLPWAVGLLVIGAGLAVLYFRQSLTGPFNSDGGAIALQARAMLHGNLLLSRWWAADVSFYTTELPEYVIVEAFRGLAPNVVHICGALTYTLTVLLAALVARGGDKGRAGIVRALIAGGILLAPGIAGGTQVFLENPDHAGTAVPILLLLLLLDRGPARWQTAAAACVLLAWTQVADQLVLVAATGPVAVVAAVRVGVLTSNRRPRAEYGYDAMLAAAAVVSVPLALGAEAALRGLGGFYPRSLPQQLLASPGQFGGNARVLGQSILLLFGANTGGGDIATYFHWIGLALAAAGLAAAVATFGRQDRVTRIVVVAVLATMAAGVASTELPGLSHAHEIGVLGPFGAVLAGRVLPGLLPDGWRRPGWRPWRVLLPALAVWIACGLAALCYAGTGNEPAPASMSLARWLSGHGFTEGLAGYWQADSTTTDSGGMVTVAPIQLEGAAIRRWESSADWYDPATHRANFIVATDDGGGLSVSTERAVFGAPAREYRVAGDVIMVYDYNLLTRLRDRAFPGTAADLLND
jgi:hypothetical protein